LKAFADLFAELDETTKTTEKVAAMVRYFRAADPADAAWAVYFLTGRKPKQVVPTKLLRQWATELAGVPDWLFDECYHAVADLAETMALLVPPPTSEDDRPLARWVEDDLLPLRGADPDTQKRVILHAWDVFGTGRRFVWNKLITGQFRVGVSQLLVVRALAEAAGRPAPTIAQRLMGDWQPTAGFFAGLVGDDAGASDPSKPYPFFLASPHDGDPAELGDVAEWAAEWKWDGIRSQLVRRAGQTFLWSRGEELVTDRYPEVTAAADALPDGTVIDGELLPWGPDGVRPFADLQKRIGRKAVGKKLLAEVPVVLLAYDLLEYRGQDVREREWSWRRATLEATLVSGGRQPAEGPVEVRDVVAVSHQPLSGLTPAARQLALFPDDATPPTELSDSPLRLSPVVSASSWEEFAVKRTESRRRGVEGFMLKRRSSPYRVGRVRGDWWKWKIAPLTVDAVLVSSQRGSGKRAGLYTDHTFAVWDAGKLVPIAKAYSGLTDAEISQVDRFIKTNTTDTFGPVRAVTPQLVMEIGFEGIQASTRHKSGVAVRFPRILRWRHDKQPTEADTLDAVKALLTPGGQGERPV
jgi:DNA ligase-1